MSGKHKGKGQSSHRQPAPKARLTLGLLTNSIQGGADEDEWRGCFAAAEALDVNLIAFPGGAWHSPLEVESQANRSFDLLDPDLLDGLIVQVQALSTYVGPAEMESFCQSHSSLLRVIIEAAYPDIPALLVNHYDAIRQLMQHLLDKHARRRIALVCAAAPQSAAAERYRAYVEALAEYQLPLDEDLVIRYADPEDGLAEQAAAALLARDPLGFDALIVDRADLAADILKTLLAHGVHVPGQVALGCFDDARTPLAAELPITTLRPDHYQKGYQALQLAVAQIRGEDVPQRSYVPFALLEQRSCGCLPTAGVAVTQPVESFDVAVAALREALLQEMRQDLAAPAFDEQLPNWHVLLLDSFLAALTTVPADGFLPVLEQLLSWSATCAADIFAWQKVLLTLRRHLRPLLQDVEMLLHAENLWQQAAALIVGTYYPRTRDHGASRQQLDKIADMLSESFDLDALMNSLAALLPALNIHSGYLALYAGSAGLVRQARLIFARADDQNVLPASEAQLFVAQKLLPAALLTRVTRFTRVVLPLYVRNEQLGFALFELPLDMAALYEPLRAQLSQALKVALLQAQESAKWQSFEALYQTSQMLAVASDTHAALHALVEDVARELSVERVFLALLDTEKRRVLDYIEVRRSDHKDISAPPFEKLWSGLISQTLLENKPLIFAKDFFDAREGLAAEPVHMFRDAGSVMLLPLHYGQDILGVMALVNARDHRDFTHKDLLLLAPLANQAALFAANARLLRATQRRDEELAVLNQLGQNLSGDLDVDTIIERTYFAMASLLEIPYFYVDLFDTERKEIVTVFQVSEDGVERPHTRRLARPQGLTEYLLETRTPLLLSDNVNAGLQEHALEKSAFLINRTVASLLGVPLLSAERAIGVMMVMHPHTPWAYGKYERDLLLAFASRVALSIDSQRLFEQTQSALQEIQSVQRRYQEQAWSHYLQLAKTPGHEIASADQPLLGDEILPEIQRVSKQRQAIVFNEDEVAGGGKTALVVPAVVREQLVGSIGVHNADSREWSEDEVALLEAIAERMAMTAENLRLLDESQRRAARERLTSDITARIRESLEVENVLQVAVREFGQALNAKEVNIRMISEEPEL